MNGTPAVRAKRPARARIFMAMASLLVFFSACRVAWVPAHSDSLETRIIAAAKANNRLYLELINDQAGNRTFDRYSRQYLEVELDINTIVLVNEARNNNQDIVQLAHKVHDKFVEYKKAHQQKGSLTAGEIETYDDYMKAFWKPLLAAEQSLR